MRDFNYNSRTDVGIRASKRSHRTSIRRHIHWLLMSPALVFVVLMSCYAFVFKIVIGGCLLYLFPENLPGPEDSLSITVDLETMGFTMTLVVSVVLVPFVETFLGQWLPIGLAGRLTQRPVALIAVSVAVFTYLHASAGLAGLTVGVVIGSFLAFSFLHWKQVSLWRAYSVTFAIHVLQNALALVVAVLRSG